MDAQQHAIARRSAQAAMVLLGLATMCCGDTSVFKVEGSAEMRCG